MFGVVWINNNAGFSLETKPNRFFFKDYAKQLIKSASAAEIN